VWSFLLWAPSLDRFTLPLNRLEYHWSVAFVVSTFAITSVCGLALFLLGLALRTVCPTRMDAVVVVTALTSLAFVAWRYLVLDPVNEFLRGVLTQTPVAVFFGSCVVALCWSRRWGFREVRRGLVNAAILLSPVLIVFWGNALTYSTYRSSSPNSLSALRGEQGSPGRTDNVYVFVFDAWSHRLTFDGSGLSPEFPNLEREARSMANVEEAYSPDIRTMVSQTRMIFGRLDPVVVADGRFRLGRSGPFADEAPSLFTWARRNGYRTYAVGWHLPYRSLLGSSAEFVRSTSIHRSDSSSWLHRLVEAGERGLVALLPMSLLQRLRVPNENESVNPRRRFALANAPPDPRGTRRGREKRFIVDTHWLVHWTKAVLEEPIGGQFALFHLPVPHTPSVFERNGVRSDLRPHRGDRSEIEWRVGIARQQHAYVDRLIGDFMDTLRASGKYESSTIVITSDHAWKEDPGLASSLPPGYFQRVPFFLKMPHQTTQLSAPGPLGTVDLKLLIDYVVAAQADSAGLLSFLSSLSSQWRGPGHPSDTDLEVTGR
jgi:hypothetical protein